MPIPYRVKYFAIRTRRIGCVKYFIELTVAHDARCSTFVLVALGVLLFTQGLRKVAGIVIRTAKLERASERASGRHECIVGSVYHNRCNVIILRDALAASSSEDARRS